MDDTIISRDTIRERGATAYDQGRGANDHRMNPGSAAIRDWQDGWHQRRVERSRARGNHVTDAGNMVAQQLEQAA